MRPPSPPAPGSPHATRLRICYGFWMAMALPWSLVLFAPQIIPAVWTLPVPLALPERFFHITYALAITVFALARFLRRRISFAGDSGQPGAFSRYLAGFMLALALAEGLVWLALALWVLSREERLLYTLELIAGIALWQHRPRSVEVEPLG